MREGVAALLNRPHEAQQTRFRPLLVGENGGSAHQHTGSSLHRQLGGLDVDAATNLQLTVRVALLQYVLCPLNFRQHVVDKALPTDLTPSGAYIPSLGTYPLSRPEREGYLTLGGNV